jgi:hypothetical protein
MRFILSIIGVVIFIVVVIVLIATHTTRTAPPKPLNLDGYNYVGTSVSQTTTGELVGEESRQAIEITISQSQRAIYLLSGYEQNVTNSESFPNTPAAYSAFLGALQNQDFTRSRKTSEVNMWGVCPFGDTYQYELSNFATTVFNRWSTSCSLNDGNFDGFGPNIRQLFIMQIPSYNNFVQNENTIS